MPTTLTLIAIFAGLLLGCASAGAVSWYLVLSRSYRAVKNRIAIRLGQLVTLVSICGGLLLIQVLEAHLRIKRHSASYYYAAVWSFLFGFICVMFLALRVDLRWQKSVGLYRKAN
jgi:zinc transporter ZupT